MWWDTGNQGSCHRLPCRWQEPLLSEEPIRSERTYAIPGCHRLPTSLVAEAVTLETPFTVYYSPRLSRLLRPLIKCVRWPWERGYGAGWDDALQLATNELLRLENSHAEGMVRKVDVRAVTDWLVLEAEHPEGMHVRLQRVREVLSIRALRDRERARQDSNTTQ